MFFVWKLFKGARSTAAWTALAGAASLGAFLFVDHFARRSIGPWMRGSWFVLSLLVALIAGVIAFPRWQAILGLVAAVGAIVWRLL